MNIQRKGNEYYVARMLTDMLGFDVGTFSYNGVEVNNDLTATFNEDWDRWEVAMYKNGFTCVAVCDTDLEVIETLQNWWIDRWGGPSIEEEAAEVYQDEFCESWGLQ